MAKRSILVFGAPDTALARSQTAALIENLAQAAARLECRQEVLEPTAQDQEDPYLACDRARFAALAEGIAAGRIRAAAVQAYDLPLPLPEGLAIHCVPARSTPFDALLNREGLIMDELADGAKVGVLCLRARNQLQCHWPQLEFRILGGGVDRAMETHLRRSEIDGLVLPASVTELLGIQGIVSEIFTPEFILPAPGQGTLTVIGAEGDTELAELLAPLHSEASARELEAERAFRSHMVSDMDLPLGVLARGGSAGLTITGATGCGSNRISVHGALHEAEAIGHGLAQQLLSSPATFVDLLEADFPQGLPEGDEEFDEDAEDDLDDDFDLDLDDLEDLD